MHRTTYLRVFQKLGPCKTPRRLKPALNLIAEMIRKHRNCGYLPLLDLACPSKVMTALLRRICITSKLFLFSMCSWNKQGHPKNWIVLSYWYRSNGYSYGMACLTFRYLQELVSEQSINPQTQLPPDNNRSAASNTTWTSLAGDSSYRTHAKDKPRFAEFMCSHLQVGLFSMINDQMKLHL